jgi:hypothetical protein
VALIGALFIHRLTSRLALLPGFAHAGSRVASITPQALARLPAPIRQAIELAFAQALPPIYGYLIPLAGGRIRARAHPARGAPADPRAHRWTGT